MRWATVGVLRAVLGGSEQERLRCSKIGQAPDRSLARFTSIWMGGSVTDPVEPESMARPASVRPVARDERSGPGARSRRHCVIDVLVGRSRIDREQSSSRHDLT